MEFAGLPDNRFDGLDLLDIVKRVEDSVARLSPEVVFSQHGGDLNMDHALTYRAVVTATRPTADNPVRTVYAYRAASSTEWAFASFAPKFRPNVFVDATGYVDRKLAALRCYESEVRPFPHPRAIEAVRAEAQYWGSIAGFDAAEAFELVRSIHGPEDLPMG
jgi:LmbE family N-acetylglucosaminyl deacetylase